MNMMSSVFSFRITEDGRFQQRRNRLRNRDGGINGEMHRCSFPSSELNLGKRRRIANSVKDNLKGDLGQMSDKTRKHIRSVSLVMALAIIVTVSRPSLCWQRTPEASQAQPKTPRLPRL